MTKRNLRERLFHAIGATSLGPVLTAVIQLVSVPVFLHFWGPKLYGDWLVLSAIPVYLGLTDFGFGAVAANDMTMLVARGEKRAALEVFQSAWLLTTAVSVSFGLCVALGLWALPIERWLKIALLSRGQVAGILCALCAYVLLDLQWSVIAAGFRSDGNYALGTLLGVITRFWTNACGIAAVVCHASPLVVALTLFAVRLLGNWACHLVLKRKSPWLLYGYQYAHFGVVRKLFGPAIGYMGLTAGNSFSYQGMTIVVAMVLGPIAVVMFSTVRTLTRFAYQMVDMVTNGVWAELSVAFGAGNRLLARNIHRCACQASLGLSFAGVLFLALFGDRIYGDWTHHKVIMDHHLFYLLLIEVLANSFWFTSAIVPLSCNRHQRQAVVYLVATAASLPTAYFLMSLFGLVGVGISLLMVDLCMIGYVLHHSLGLLDDNLIDFSRALFRAPSLNADSLGAGG
jgi:O-antigen/teichoic acid export membrane protein